MNIDEEAYDKLVSALKGGNYLDVAQMSRLTGLQRRTVYRYLDRIEADVDAGRLVRAKNYTYTLI